MAKSPLMRQAPLPLVLRPNRFNRVDGVDDDGPATCAAVRKVVGDDAVRIVKSGTFRKQ
jgi:hypothetical protein